MDLKSGNPAGSRTLGTVLNPPVLRVPVEASRSLSVGLIKQAASFCSYTSLLLEATKVSLTSHCSTLTGSLGYECDG